MQVTNLEMDRKCESPCPRLNQNKIRALSFSPAFNSVNTEKNEWKRYSRHLEGVIEQLLQKRLEAKGKYLWLYHPTSYVWILSRTYFLNLKAKKFQPLINSKMDVSYNNIRIDHVRIKEGRNYEDFQNLDEFLLGDTHEQSNQKDNSFENQATNKMFETQEARGEFGRTETIKRKSESHRKKDPRCTPLDTKFIEDWIRVSLALTLFQKKRASSGMMIHKHPVNPLRWEEVKEHPCGEGQRQGSNPLQRQLCSS
ncbi:unnamed protein product [Moneuplotes crassus]|uniref:Uncharacterized protein n=1 Tax=Euplotes crassus TaxID=5936 RepID=A0AAD2D396_EUPCR|nr:unnamed protein product [Moneuplotes crassus]